MDIELFLTQRPGNISSGEVTLCQFVCIAGLLNISQLLVLKIPRRSFIFAIGCAAIQVRLKFQHGGPVLQG